MLKFVSAVASALVYPAFLFSAGNSFLALGHAETLGILLNFAIAVSIYSARVFETLYKKNLGIPFWILALTNFLTFISIEVNIALGTHHGLALAGHLSAAAFLVWSVGHWFAGLRDKKNDRAKTPLHNPQTYYGVADMVAVNATGTLNPLSFPFMGIGFIRSIFTKQTSSENMVVREITSARIYGVGYLVGALTTLATPLFALAQVFWALAYLSFKRDT